jgi:hypothetical protein
MGLSDKTVKKLLSESEAEGGRIYNDDEVAHEDDVTHFEEDDNPPTQAGEPVDEDGPVGEVPSEGGTGR